MRLTPNNPMLLALSTLIGEGWRSPDGNCILHLAQRGGEGLLWPVKANDEQQWVWCAENQWCEWIAPVLSVHDFSEVPDDIIDLIVSWGAPPIAPFIAETEWTSPVRGCTVKRWDPVFTIRQDGRELTCRLIDWPIELIRQLTSEWEPVNAGQTEEFSLTASLQAGWFAGSLSQLSKWQPGDGIRIKQAAMLDQRQLWLALPGKKILLEQQETGEFIVQESINESDLPLEEEAEGIIAIEDLSFTISVEIGRIALPLATLSALKPGDCLSGLTQFDDSVRLLLQGQCIGRGNLLQIGDQWVVRIADLNSSVAAK